MRFFCVYNSNQCSIVIEHYYHLDHQHHHKAQIYPLNNNNKKKTIKIFANYQVFFVVVFIHFVLVHHLVCLYSSRHGVRLDGWMDGYLVLFVHRSRFTDSFLPVTVGSLLVLFCFLFGTNIYIL